MTPIQGLMVSSVLTNRNNWLFSLFMVLSGVGSVVLVGYIFGWIITPSLVFPENNDQVSARINPAIPDLIAALATGMVGAISIGKWMDWMTALTFCFLPINDSYFLLLLYSAKGYCRRFAWSGYFDFFGSTIGRGGSYASNW